MPSLSRTAPESVQGLAIDSFALQRIMATVKAVPERWTSIR
jgi:hypothetical protein